MTLFNGWGLNVSKLQSHYEETVYFLLQHPKISSSQYYLDGLNITLTVTTWKIFFTELPDLLAGVFMYFSVHFVLLHVSLRLKKLPIYYDVFVENFMQKFLGTLCLDILACFRSILEYIPQILENFIWNFVH